MMTTREWQLTERARRQQYLDRLQAGSATTQGRRGPNSPIVDNTAQTIEIEKAAIIELDGLIAQNGIWVQARGRAHKPPLDLGILAQRGRELLSRRWMAACRSAIERNTPRRMRWRVRGI